MSIWLRTFTKKSMVQKHVKFEHNGKAIENKDIYETNYS